MDYVDDVSLRILTRNFLLGEFMFYIVLPFDISYVAQLASRPPALQAGLGLGWHRPRPTYPRTPFRPDRIDRIDNGDGGGAFVVFDKQCSNLLFGQLIVVMHAVLW